jgi:hypothetical protein
MTYESWAGCNQESVRGLSEVALSRNNNLDFLKLDLLANHSHPKEHQTAMIPPPHYAGDELHFGTEIQGDIESRGLRKLTCIYVDVYAIS